MKTLALPFLTPALVLALAACGNASPDMAQNTTPAPDGQWRITEIGGTPADGALQLDTADHSYSANIGCNTHFGEYRIDGQRIRFSNGASSLRGCEAALMARDTQLGESLAAGSNWQQQGEALEIRDANGQVVLRATR